MDADVWRQAKGVLAEALLIPPHERDALVVERCPDLLLRREVQAYLHQYDENFLGTVLTVSNTFDHATPSDGEVPPDVHPGEHIGPYVVIERLGVGGMGHVFLGNDTRLHRKVALKCLIASASAEDLRSRILHEARAAARINHANIATVHDVVDHDGRPFLVMEYVEGENLATMLRRERPPIGKILAMGRQLASALAAAHAKGIIHRDLKPANIQVMPDGLVKILDFGIAQAMSMLATEVTPRTTTDNMPLSTRGTLQGDRGGKMHPGTPAYMSPEQMFGRPIDHRSDLYSLGVIMYEMATGHRPYSAEDPLDVVLALSRSLLRPTGAETNLPPDVSDVIGKMLAVKPEERYQTATELETAIVALIGPDSTLAAQVRPATMWSRTRPVARVAVIVMMVPLIVGFLGFATNAAFNVALDRPAPFGAEPPRVWLELGLRSLVTPLLIYLLPLIVSLWAARFAFRLLRLSGPVDRLVTTSRTRSAKLGTKIGLSDPVVFGQGVTTAGVLALVIVSFVCWDVIRAITIIVPVRPDMARLVLPLHSNLVHVYRFALTVLIAAFSVALVRMSRMSQPGRRSLGAMTAVAVLLLFAVGMAELPYRYMWQTKLPRVSFAGERCYMTGEQPDRLLLFCPDLSPPRNRIVRRNDPLVQQSGTVESIFTPPETSR